MREISLRGSLKGTVKNTEEKLVFFFSKEFWHLSSADSLSAILYILPQMIFQNNAKSQATHLYTPCRPVDVAALLSFMDNIGFMS